MTVTAFNKKNLIGFADRPGNDVKARLLLALTALYVERPVHTEEEKRQYAELAQRLIDVVDDATRATVAAILHDDPTDPIEISEPMPPDAPPADISPPDAPSAPVTAIGPAPDPQSISAAEGSDAGARWGEAFFAATAAERRELLALIAKECAGQSVAHVKDIAPADCQRLDAAALQGRIGELIREFESVLDLPHSVCERIINDCSGEPMVVAAMAAGIPIAVLQRFLLLVNPAVGHSVERVFDLTRLFYELDRGAATRLMSLWRDDARRDEARSPPSPRVASPIERPPVGLRARFGALSERIQDRSVTSRSDPESGVRRDLRFR